MRLEIEKGLNTVAFFIARHIDVFLVLILVVFSSVVFFPNLGSAPMWTGDEQVYFQWADHIVKSGDYLTPWAFNSVCLGIAKPPLIIWLMSFSLRVFEQNFAARFWSAFFGVLSTVFVFYTGKLLFNRIVGLLSASILLTFATFYAIARLGQLDVPLTFFLLGSVYFFLKSENSQKENQYAVLSGIFFGLALMTKQLSALLIPLTVFFYLLFSQKSPRFLLRKPFFLLVGIGLLIFSPWVILMTIRFGTDFLNVFFYFSVFQRATGVIDYYSGGYLYYVSYLFSSESLFWLILLPFAGALSFMRGALKQKKEHILLLVWIAVVLGVFSFSQTKISYYIVPIFPAFALILGNLLYELFRRFRAWTLIPISALILILLVAPLASTQMQLVASAEKHLDYAGDSRVTSVASVPSSDKFPKIVTGGYFTNGTAQVANLNIWNFTGQAFELLASNHLEKGTTINSVVTGNVNGDSQVEIASVGTRDNGSRKVAQLSVWNSSTLALENKTEWCWGGDTTGNAVAVGAFESENQLEIVTAGTFYNGSCTFAILCVWNGRNLSLENTTCWATSGNTTIDSVAISDIENDGLNEIVVGGYRLEGGKEIAQITVWNSTLNLKMANADYAGATSLWNANVRINSLAISDIDGDGFIEIVAAGYCYQNKSTTAQITIWNGRNLSLKRNIVWSWNNGSSVNSLTVGDCDGDKAPEIITAGSYFNGTCNYAQIFVSSGSSMSLKASTSWYWGTGTQVNVITTVNDLYNGRIQILTGGSFNNGTHEIAQLTASQVQS